MDREWDSKTEISGTCPDTWICHDPVFACDAVNPDLLEFSPWSGHRRFAYDYVRNVRPAVIAELGTFYGCSAFAFQQAILDGGLDTVFTAVDTWQGDAFTREDYREPVREAYEEVQRTCISTAATVTKMSAMITGPGRIRSVPGARSFSMMWAGTCCWAGRPAAAASGGN